MPLIDEPAPRGPKTLLRRLSSGITHVLPVLRTTTPSEEFRARPATTPSQDLSARKTSRAAKSEQLVVSQPQSSTSEPGQPFPYDPNSYHSFASIEKRRCSFCGMRGPKIVYDDQCHECRNGNLGVHITAGSRHANVNRRHAATETRHLSHIIDDSSSTLLGPRLVTPERAAKRTGNPTRISKLPPGIVRLPAANAVEAHQQREIAAKPLSKLARLSLDGQKYNLHAHGYRRSSKDTTAKKPTSPKLHHVHGLPGSENFPFVHRNEVLKHAVAIRAGSSSPLTDKSNSPIDLSAIREPSDNSDTVYYGKQRSPSSSTRTTTPKPHITTVVARELHTGGSAMVDTRAVPLCTTFVDEEICRTQPLQQDLERKGGRASSDELPQLRGGSAPDGSYRNSFSFKLKRWLLTCHGPCPDYLDTDSDADLDPPRIVSSERVTYMQQKMNGCAQLPANLSRRARPVSPTSDAQIPPEAFLPSTGATTTIMGPPKLYLSSRFSTSSLSDTFHRRPVSPINQPAPLDLSPVLTYSVPHLRGGAKSSSKIPLTIFWLVGGRGNPISFSAWKQSRPKQRMGGLLGMAVFGDKYGAEYNNGRMGSSGILCSSSIKVIVEDAVSCKSVKDDVSASSSSKTSAAPVRKVMTDTEASVPAPVIEPERQALTPPAVGSVDDTLHCSSALFVEPPGASNTIPTLPGLKLITRPTLSNPIGRRENA